MKSINPKLTQKQITEEIVLTDSATKRYKNDILMKRLCHKKDTK